MCVHEKREGRGGRNYKRNGKILLSSQRANGKMVYEEEEGGNRGPGAKVERKQVDNDRFNQISTTNKTIPRIPQPFTIHTFRDFST